MVEKLHGVINFTANRGSAGPLYFLLIPKKKKSLNSLECSLCSQATATVYEKHT